MKKLLTTKRLAAVVLALALCLGGVHAAGEELFPAVNAYPGYADVGETAWYYGNVRLCNEVGLMNGTDKGFQPEKTLTVAECAAVAARIREKLTGEAIPGVTPLPGETLPWYQQYLGYMRSADAKLTPMLAHPEEPCSRMQYLMLLNAALPAEQGLLSAINSITSLPDTDDAAVLKFYNAGILTGVDEQGTFDGGKSLTRAECAAMVSRIVRPELRQSFTPKAKEPSQGQEVSPDAAAVTVNGQAISLNTILAYTLQTAYNQDLAFYQSGSRLDWDQDYGVGDLETFFLQEGINTAIQVALLDQQAAALGCARAELPAKLVPDPGRDALSAFAQERDYLCAKHILVGDTDTAKAVLDGLKAVPTLDQFNALLTVFGTDPGMTANPDGYLFSAGEMVSEFESGTRALEFGAYSAEPVQSTYGYHIIWRLDPAEHPELLTRYQDSAMLSLLDGWIQAADITVDQAALASVSVRAEYANYLQYLASQAQQ